MIKNSKFNYLLKQGENITKLKIVILSGFLIFSIPVSVFSQTIIKSLPAPGAEPRGLAWDGSYLWCAEYFSGKIYKLDPSNGAKVDSVSFQIMGDYGGITWGNNGQLWVANGSYIYQINPASGDTTSSFHCPGG
jgi:DNA-binding beta-propeller fold protein YncE